MAIPLGEQLHLGSSLPMSESEIRSTHTNTTHTQREAPTKNTVTFNLSVTSAPSCPLVSCECQLSWFPEALVHPVLKHPRPTTSWEMNERMPRVETQSLSMDTMAGSTFACKQLTAAPSHLPIWKALQTAVLLDQSSELAKKELPRFVKDDDKLDGQWLLAGPSSSRHFNTVPHTIFKTMAPTTVRGT